MAMRHHQRKGLSEAAGPDLVIGKGADGHGQAPALDCGFLRQDVAVEGQAIGELDASDARRFEPQAPVFLGGIDIEELVLLEIVGRPQRIRPFDETGRTDGRQERAEERAVVVARPPVAGENEAGIDIGLVEVPVELGGRQAHLHIGEAALEIMEPGDQPFERHGDIDLDRQLVVGGGGAQAFRLAFDLVESIAHGREIGMPRLGELGAPRIALEELKAQLLLQRFHLMAHRRAGDPELAACEPERAEPCGGLEGGQGAKRRKIAAGQEFTKLSVLSLYSTWNLSKVREKDGEFHSPATRLIRPSRRRAAGAKDASIAETAMSVIEDVARRRGGREARRALRARPIPVDEAAVRPGMEGGKYKPLAERDMERIHEAALGLLETVGLAQAIPSCIEMQTAKGCFISGEGRLCFPRALIEDTLAHCAREFVLYGRSSKHDMEPWGNKVYFGTAGAA